MCIDFYDLSTWGGCWFVVYIRRFIYKSLNECPFDYTVVAGSGKFGPVNRLTTPVGWPLLREKGRDLTQSYDKSPYTSRIVKRAK